MTAADRRSSRFRNQVKSSAGAPPTPGPDEGNPTPDRLLVSHALAQLCAEHRAVICRSYYEGLSTAQIAADLGIAEGMVKSRMHYALRALRDTLQKQIVTEAQATDGWPSNLDAFTHATKSAVDVVRRQHRL